MAYINDLLTPDERAIIQAVLPAENFRVTALAEYGEEWVDHIPQDINAFTMRFFKTALFPYHLAFYYCPVPEGTVHGGRGSGKTVGFGLGVATYCALHPGEDHLHIAPSKDQTRKTFDAIMGKGGPDGLERRYVELFVEDYVVAPFPEIRLRKWDKADPGTVIRFRPLGDENIELLRSHESGSITFDEAFRTVESGDTISALRGCIRGLNQYRFNLLPKEKQFEITMRMNSLTLIPDPRVREQLNDELQNELKELGLAKRGFMCVYGNAGNQEWEWQRHDMADERPDHYWSFTATTYDNPFYGRDNVEALEEKYLDDPEGREVEMEAGRPRNLGDVFLSHQVEHCTNRQLLGEVQAHIEDGLPGYAIEKKNNTGIYHYRTPPIPGHYHVIAADPGAGIAPGRNKWVIGVFDVSVLPCRMVYFRMGNLKRAQAGGFYWFILYLKEAFGMYPSAPGDMWIESTGPQKGMTQVVWPDELKVQAVEFSTQKMELINYTKRLLEAGVYEWPAITRLLTELGNYQLPDTDLVQDIVCMILCASGAVWKYHPVKKDKYRGPNPNQQRPAVVIDRTLRVPIAGGRR